MLVLYRIYMAIDQERRIPVARAAVVPIQDSLLHHPILQNHHKEQLKWSSKVSRTQNFRVLNTNVRLGCCKGVSRKTQDEITIPLILRVMLIVLSTFRITESCEKRQSILILRAFNYTDYLKKRKRGLWKRECNLPFLTNSHCPNW